LLNLRVRMQLGVRFLARLRKIELRLEEQPVRALQLAAHFLRESVALKANRVQAKQLDRVADGLHERGDILRHSRTSADEAELPDLDELVNSCHARDDGLVLDGDMAGELRGITDDHAVPDMAIV